jgi:DNA modification methylase
VKPYILHNADNLAVLRSMPDNSVDSIVTDPPYGLSFMGKKWDYDVPSSELWAECLRVLKPGGHLLAFAGTRTQHRMAVRIEDAGFEIRDMIAWVYGSGFPKSLDISKAIDNAAGVERDVVLTIPDRWAGKGQTLNRNGRDVTNGSANIGGSVDITAPATEAARQWEGWGTSLKPALEPVTVARKPFDTTVAENVLTHGTGGLNIDGCRVPTEDKLGGGAEKAETVCATNHEGWDRPWKHDDKAREAHAERVRGNVGKAELLGRWPANLIHDGSEEVVAGFPVSNGKGGDSSGSTALGQGSGWNAHSNRTTQIERRNDSGSAARFFYCAKASKRDREEGLAGFRVAPPGELTGGRKEGSAGLDSPRAGAGRTAGRSNHHPTVKPTDLMRYLCRLVTPPGGVVLDPFMGSGSTGKAAMLEGFGFIGIEREAEYVAIAERRIAAVCEVEPVQEEGRQMSLFGAR